MAAAGNIGTETGVISAGTSICILRLVISGSFNAVGEGGSRVCRVMAGRSASRVKTCAFRGSIKGFSGGATRGVTERIIGARQIGPLSMSNKAIVPA